MSNIKRNTKRKPKKNSKNKRMNNNKNQNIQGSKKSKNFLICQVKIIIIMAYKHDCEKLNCKSKSDYKGKCEHGLPRDRSCSDCRRTVKGGLEIICKCGFASSPTGMFDHELECEQSRPEISCLCG